MLQHFSNDWLGVFSPRSCISTLFISCAHPMILCKDSTGKVNIWYPKLTPPPNKKQQPQTIECWSNHWYIQRHRPHPANSTSERALLHWKPGHFVPGFRLLRITGRPINKLRFWEDLKVCNLCRSLAFLFDTRHEMAPKIIPWYPYI